MRSANFDANETVEKLADILKSALQLKKCVISYQQGSRKVKAEIEYASEGRMGCIVLSDRKTQQEICRRETSKTEADHKIEIDY